MTSGAGRSTPRTIVGPPSGGASSGRSGPFGPAPEDALVGRPRRDPRPASASARDGAHRRRAARHRDGHARLRRGRGTHADQGHDLAGRGRRGDELHRSRHLHQHGSRRPRLAARLRDPLARLDVDAHDGGRPQRHRLPGRRRLRRDRQAGGRDVRGGHPRGRQPRAPAHGGPGPVLARGRARADPDTQAHAHAPAQADTDARPAGHATPDAGRPRPPRSRPPAPPRRRPSHPSSPSWSRCPPRPPSRPRASPRRRAPRRPPRPPRPPAARAASGDRWPP